MLSLNIFVARSEADAGLCRGKHQASGAGFPSQGVAASFVYIEERPLMTAGDTQNATTGE